MVELMSGQRAGRGWSGNRGRRWSECPTGNRGRHGRYCWGSGYTRSSDDCPGICTVVASQGSARYAWTERDQNEQGCKRSHKNSHKTLFFRLN